MWFCVGGDVVLCRRLSLWFKPCREHAGSQLEAVRERMTIFGRDSERVLIFAGHYERKTAAEPPKQNIGIETTKGRLKSTGQLLY